MRDYHKLKEEGLTFAPNGYVYVGYGDNEGTLLNLVEGETELLYNNSINSRGNLTNYWRGNGDGHQYYVTEEFWNKKFRQPKTFLERVIAGEPIQTRAGKEAKFIAYVPEREHQKKLFIFWGGDVIDYIDNGIYYTDNEKSDRDIILKADIEKPRWVNVYSVSVHSYPTKEEADKYAQVGRLACLELKFKIGQGIS